MIYGSHILTQKSTHTPVSVKDQKLSHDLQILIFFPFIDLKRVFISVRKQLDIVNESCSDMEREEKFIGLSALYHYPQRQFQLPIRLFSFLPKNS